MTREEKLAAERRRADMDVLAYGMILGFLAIVSSCCCLLALWVAS